MDDLEQAFGGQRPVTPLEEAWHNAQRRKAFDTIRIKNPTSEDFYVMYDINQYQKVPAYSTIDVPYHIAIRYVQHMKDKIINDRAKKMHDEIINERRSKGLPEFRDKATENAETYLLASFPKTDDPKLIAEIYNELWVGTVAFYGRDLPPAQRDARAGEVDLTPPETKILESLGKRMAEMPASSAPQSPAPSSYIPYSQPPTASIPPAPSGFSALNEKLSPKEIINETD